MQATSFPCTVVTYALSGTLVGSSDPGPGGPRTVRWVAPFELYSTALSAIRLSALVSMSHPRVAPGIPPPAITTLLALWASLWWFEYEKLK